MAVQLKKARWSVIHVAEDNSSQTVARVYYRGIPDTKAIYQEARRWAMRDEAAGKAWPVEPSHMPARTHDGYLVCLDWSTHPSTFIHVEVPL